MLRIETNFISLLICFNDYPFVRKKGNNDIKLSFLSKKIYVKFVNILYDNFSQRIQRLFPLYEG